VLILKKTFIFSCLFKEDFLRVHQESPTIFSLSIHNRFFWTKKPWYIDSIWNEFDQTSDPSWNPNFPSTQIQVQKMQKF